MSIDSEVAIRVNNLSKEFKLYEHPSDMFKEIITGRPRYRAFWALENISFEVFRGQAVGLLGRNGAGKSTLLKIISGTLDKTSGEILTNGRISSILELGTGFNAEYTGRENIYLGGLMIGLSNAEIMEKEDWIIEFSELRNFIDQPFKTYSSGMQARLTFATAVCVDPDILIVDEALSVGDAKFARKSFAKMEEFRKNGKTIVLVSHNSNQVASFCDFGLILENGRIYDSGEPSRLRSVYFNLLFGKESVSQTESSLIIPVKQETPIDMELEGAIEYHLDSRLFKPEKGHCWQIDISNLKLHGDSDESHQRSSYLLYENEIQVGPAHSLHDSIRKIGQGLYSHWNTQLLFSTSDNSNPATNERTYSLRRKDTIPIQTFDEMNDPDRLKIKYSALKKLHLNQQIVDHSTKSLRYGNRKAEIVNYAIVDQHGTRTNYLKSGNKYSVVFQAVFYEDVSAVSTGFTINTIYGMELFGVNSVCQDKIIRNVKKGLIVESQTDLTMWLTNGCYFLTVAVDDADATDDIILDKIVDALQFEVELRQNIHHASIVNLDEDFKLKVIL